MSESYTPQKVIAIVGPTATGKTALAYHLAKLLPIELITADSRQVYKHMTIGTGKDLPSDAIFHKDPDPHYELPTQQTKMWMMDLLDPDESWSVAQFAVQAREVIHSIWERQHIPVIVGGTGFYLQQLINPANRVFIPPNQELREALVNQSVSELQEVLASLDGDALLAMNNSDKQNPTRLVRAIEIAEAKEQQELQHATPKSDPNPNPDPNSTAQHSTQQLEPLQHITFGLHVPLETLKLRIEHRVHLRIEQGMISEVERLMKLYPDWRYPSFTSTGYREVRDYLYEKTSFEEMSHLWATREFHYAKRQLTWFKKQNEIRWADPLQTPIEELAKQLADWYHQS